MQRTIRFLTVTEFLAANNKLSKELMLQIKEKSRSHTS